MGTSALYNSSILPGPGRPIRKRIRKVKMYPFNRTKSLTGDEEYDEVEPLPTINGSTESETTVGNIIEMGKAEFDNWTNDLQNGHVNVELGSCTWRGVTCVSRNLRHLLIFLRCLALFPGFSPRRNQVRTFKRVAKYFFLINLSLLAIAFNGYLLYNNMWLIQLYQEKFGLMHASSVSCIITGIKPLINAFVIGLFLIKVNDHLKLLRVDVCFRSAFHISPPIFKYKVIFFILVIFAFILPFMFRLVEFIVTEQVLGNSLIGDLAFIIVPVLTLWNIVPLMYYDLYNRIVRFYCRVLVKSLNKEHKRRHYSLKFYYEQFLRITNVQESIGNLFNPFLLFSLAWSMLVLCLTIYFITQPHSSLIEPISEEQVVNPKTRYRLTRSVHFTMCWAALQMVVAFMHIIVICSTGMHTNETTRQIVNAVLRIVPDANADLDRFQISCFVHKMSTQFMWGMTVWRAFPLERTTFFTMVSVVVTYSFLLLKLKENPAVMPISRTIVIFQNYTMNATINPI